MMPGLAALADDVPDDASAAPRSRPPVPWTTRLWIRLDISVHRGFPWLFVIGLPLCLVAAVPFGVLGVLMAGTGKGVILGAQAIGAVVMAKLIVWGWDQLSHRTNGRAARADEVTALRGYAKPGTWAYVRDEAASLRSGSPRYPVTIAMILRWQDEAAARIRAAVPPMIAEQAAARAQARAFE